MICVCRLKLHRQKIETNSWNKANSSYNATSGVPVKTSNGALVIKPVSKSLENEHREAWRVSRVR
jgi:hypothetical protein